MAMLLTGKVKDLGGFSVRRVLPHSKKRMVGPFIFFDHMGQAEFQPGDGIDVRPHPHIGLATITYLFEGEILHRDSLGTVAEILPGDVNIMVSGSGIMHSEREPIEVKSKVHRVAGIQSWIALPKAMAEAAPSFTHVSRHDLPCFVKEGVMKRLVVGEAEEMVSPAKIPSPGFYLDVLAQKGRVVTRPNPDQECMVYIVFGEIDVNGSQYQEGDSLLLDSTDTIAAVSNSRMIMIGGTKWDEVPHIEWNFVAFDRDRIEQAKADWRAQRFPTISGDDQEYMPLPE